MKPPAPPPPPTRFRSSPPSALALSLCVSFSPFNRTQNGGGVEHNSQRKKRNEKEDTRWGVRNDGGVLLLLTAFFRWWHGVGWGGEGSFLFRPLSSSWSWSSFSSSWSSFPFRCDGTTKREMSVRFSYSLFFCFRLGFIFFVSPFFLLHWLPPPSHPPPAVLPFPWPTSRWEECAYLCADNETGKN